MHHKVHHTVKDNITSFKAKLPDHVCLIAVSKTKPSSMIQSAFDAGQIDFGENKAQELIQKAVQLPDQIKWHFIGHLQRNKVKQIIDYVYLIHSVDSLSLLDEIEKRARLKNKQVNVLLQIHMAQEDSKFGFSEDQIQFLCKENTFQNYQYVKVLGLMTMATNTSDQALIGKEFNALKFLFEKIKAYFSSDFKVLSMGMSADYELAIDAGSNMVRIGSAIFGNRNYES